MAENIEDLTLTRSTPCAPRIALPAGLACAGCTSADSLDAVKQDLAGANGPALIVLVTDGDALELEQGAYRVVVRTTPSQRFDDVRVSAGQSVNLDL